MALKPNQIIHGGKIVIDLTNDTVKADKLLKGYTAHGADGEILEGTLEAVKYRYVSATMTLPGGSGSRTASVTISGLSTIESVIIVGIATASNGYPSAIKVTYPEAAAITVSGATIRYTVSTATSGSTTLSVYAIGTV